MLATLLCGALGLGSNVALAHSDKHSQKHVQKYSNSHVNDQRHGQTRDRDRHYYDHRGHDHAYARAHKRAHKHYRKHKRVHRIHYRSRNSHNNMAGIRHLNPAFYIMPHGTVAYMVPHKPQYRYKKNRRHNGQGWR